MSDPAKQAASKMIQSFVLMAMVLFVASLLFAYLFSSRADQTGVDACRYQRAAYPSNRQFRIQMRGLARLVYLDALHSKDVLRAAKARTLWLTIKLPPTPTCKE